ncbi:MAG: hypothetical protein QT08_C0022G0006 [archaeon GW2011_AR17]|nr:MAG: hypothetical protein QT08_C0022G0006 [archaeon GW2011_AR17]MBS3154571.1 hypothetical protein [Candidatus Woesearchaeota archaeon]HIH59502.1 hypothetical protein [Nanoarchaeota archaeon]
MQDLYFQYYSRKDIQEALLKVCDDREVAPRYGEGFGRRPDTLQYPGDILEMAKKGATSFHISEEHWHDPLQLKAGMSKKDLDENRKGWDLILDIDTVHWDYAKWTAYFLIEALKFHDVKNIAVKFSGSKGFHIAVPFASFPEEVNGVKTHKLFPEGPRIITAYLQNMIHEMLANKILEKENIANICQKTNLKRSDLIKDGKFDPFVLIEIDTVLISNRHLFRAPYSLHEKTGLVSLPIDIDKILTFDKREADPKIVKADKSFLEKKVKNDGKSLIIQAMDWWGKKHAKQGPDVIPGTRFERKLPTDAIAESCFPHCMQQLLAGNMEDGKKRALFILVNFLRHMNWREQDIEKRLFEWNLKNKNPLPVSYISSQLSWNKKQKETILPPNCNKSYYKDLRVSCAETICSRFKNPINCALRMHAQAKELEKKKKPEPATKMADASPEKVGDKAQK